MHQLPADVLRAGVGGFLPHPSALACCSQRLRRDVPFALPEPFALVRERIATGSFRLGPHSRWQPGRCARAGCAKERQMVIDLTEATRILWLGPYCFACEQEVYVRPLPSPR